MAAFYFSFPNQIFCRAQICFLFHSLCLQYSLLDKRRSFSFSGLEAFYIDPHCFEIHHVLTFYSLPVNSLPGVYGKAKE